MEIYTENIICEACGRETIVQLKEDSRFYCQLPSGWMFTNSYPTGDDILFVCSEKCADQFYKERMSYE